MYIIVELVESVKFNRLISFYLKKNVILNLQLHLCLNAIAVLTGKCLNVHVPVPVLVPVPVRAVIAICFRGPAQGGWVRHRRNDKLRLAILKHKHQVKINDTI